MKTVYVLGAGASMASRRVPGGHLVEILRMPSGSKFFRDVFFIENMRDRDRRHLHFLGLMYPDTTDFLADFWGLPRVYSEDPEAWHQVNIEEMFSVVDVGVASLPRGSRELKAMRHIRDCLLDFIDTSIWVRTESQYCDRLKQLFETLPPQDTIITFNWDTLADATLDKLELPQYERYIETMHGVDLNYTQGGLLKLHGSINWFTCPNPNCKNHYRISLEHRPQAGPGHRLNSRLGEGNEKRKCPLCGRDEEAALIPPTSRKLLDRGSLVHSLWMQARVQLNVADRLVIIGYSLPKTDVHAEWLFRELQLEHSRDETPQLEIILVDPGTKDPESDLMNRYRSIFHKTGIAKTYSSFQSYVSAVTRKKSPVGRTTPTVMEV